MKSVKHLLLLVPTQPLASKCPAIDSHIHWRHIVVDITPATHFPCLQCAHLFASCPAYVLHDPALATIMGHMNVYI